MFLKSLLIYVSTFPSYFPVSLTGFRKQVSFSVELTHSRFIWLLFHGIIQLISISSVLLVKSKVLARLLSRCCFVFHITSHQDHTASCFYGKMMISHCQSGSSIVKLHVSLYDRSTQYRPHAERNTKASRCSGSLGRSRVARALRTLPLVHIPQNPVNFSRLIVTYWILHSTPCPQIWQICPVVSTW